MIKMFRGKNVLITGGSRGIGFSLAMEFASHGANVALIARNKENLNFARREVESYGVRCLAYACDVTDSDTLRDYINMVRYEFGRIDGVIANSGYCHPGRFHEIALDDFDRQIDTNLKGVVYTLHHAIPHLLSQEGGFIAITSSPAGNAGIFGFSAYGPTKAALNNLAYVLRAEYADRDIRVHLLLPPDTATPGYAAELELYPPETEAILNSGRLHDPDRVAKTFVDGIIANKKTIAVGWETHALLWSLRVCPFVWDWYVKMKKRAVAKRAQPESMDATVSENVSTEEEERDTAA